MTTVSLASSKPPITLTSARGITITIDRSVNTSSGGGSGTVTSVTATSPVVITGTPTTVPNVTLSGINATQTTAGIFSPARLATGTADATTFLRGDSTWTDDVPLQVNVKNTSGGALTKGTPVYATGTVGATAVIEVAAADASVSAKMPAIGLLLQDLAQNGTGLVMVMGTITSINTLGYAINSGMFVAPGGGLTNTRPTAATDLVQNVARVTRVSATTGSVLVLGPGRTNDVPNLIATNYLASSGTASATTFLRGDQSWSSAVTGVTGTAPIASSGGAAPIISIGASSVSAAGSMSSADFTKLSGITAAAVPALQTVIPTLTVSGTIAENAPASSIFASVTGPTTGVLLLTGIWLAKGTVCTSISFHSSTTAAGTPTNQWFVLADLNRVSLANTTNDTTTAWPANTTKTLALTAPFTTTYSGLHYIGVCVTATTMLTYRGLGYSTMTPVKLQSFTSTTGLTTPPAVPTTFAAYAANASLALGGIS